ncbi:MAG: hypothetical protein M1812_007581 [Candelaria pacifica]|nr:MAG: hypothetical protein M1812_007581 [Candelaria pacifica]
MDPLSITASVITVIQAAGAVISVCYDYRSSRKSSSWELPKVIEEVKSLRDILEALEELAVKAERPNGSATVETQLPTLKRLCEPKGQLAGCKGELEALEKKLLPSRWSGPAGSKRRGLIEALSWPLQEGETRKILENIGRFKASLNIALMADQGALVLETHSMTGQILQSSQVMQSDLTSIKSGIFAYSHPGKPRTYTKITDELHGTILQWLAAPDPSLNHNAARRRCQATTGSWFTGSEQFIDWRKSPDTFLWLHGIPGCGKTILSSTIIEDVISHCGVDSNLAVVYFYFDFNDAEKQETEKMIRSLLSQLGRQRSTAQALRSLYSACKTGGRSPTSNELLETLRGMVQEFDGVFIILDALDECKERDRLLEGISEWAGWPIGKLHTILTSRREKDIEEMLGPLIGDGEKVCIQSTLVDEDIRTYVHEKLQTDRGMRRWQRQPKVQMEIEMTLMEKADGMFRWAACQIDALGMCLDLKSLRKALASLPESLEETYARILNNMYPYHRKSAFRIFQWLVYSARPLRLEEIVDVIAVDQEGEPRFDIERRFAEPLDVLTICSSLVTVVEEEKGEPGSMPPVFVSTGKTLIRLAHFSVKEYLVSGTIQAGSAAWCGIQEVPANRSMAEVCLAYLLQFDQYSFDKQKTIEEYPLAGYAAEFWFQHANLAGEDNDAMNSLSMELLQYNKNTFTNWTELFNPDQLWGYCRPSSRRELASPIYYTALTGLLVPTRLLIEAGADVNAQGGNLYTALQAASWTGHGQIVQQLLKAGADVNAQGGIYDTALHAASYAGHDGIVEQLLKAGADVNAQGGIYDTALHAASYAGHDGIVEQLLKAGAQVNAQGGRFNTALHAASQAGNDQIVQQLLKAGADVNAQGEPFYTALHAASEEGHDQIVQQLLKAGADVNAQGGVYDTALQAASYKGHDQIVQQLLKAGADVNAQSEPFYTALQAASYKGHDQIVQQLLKAGADVNAQDGRFNTALYAASQRGHDGIVQRLREAGAIDYRL